MHVLVFGGTGFVGLNIAAAFHRAQHRVTLFDQKHSVAGFTTASQCIIGDVRDQPAVREAVASGVDVVILGAAITAGPDREALDPDSILAVNLASHPPILDACRRSGVRRIINLSSAAAYGSAVPTAGHLVESTCAAPDTLYAITKYSSELVGRRLADLWGLDLVSVRLSAVFGRWERDTGVRDTLSPQAQILDAAANGREAILARPGERDWIYATDVAEAVLAIAETRKTCQHLYNVSTGTRWSALDWGRAFAHHMPGFICRLAEPGETPTVNLHAKADRPSLATALLKEDIGWSARFGKEASAQDLADWWHLQAGSRST